MSHVKVKYYKNIGNIIEKYLLQTLLGTCH